MIRFDKNGNSLPDQGDDALVDIIKDKRKVERYEADAFGRIMVVLHDQGMIVFFTQDRPIMAKFVADNFTCALDDRIRAAKSRYLYAFEAEFRRLWQEHAGQKPDWSQLTGGMWTNAHMYYGLREISAEDAAKKWFDERMGKSARRRDLIDDIKATPHG